jgi:MATE family multidrug resistance protein
MSWPLHFHKTLTLAIPLALGQLMSIGINTADIIAMGQLGTHELAAGSLAARYFQPFFFMGMGLMLAVGPLVAQGLGGNDDRLVRRALRQGLFLAVAVGLVFILPIAGGRTVLIWLGQDPDILVHADEFLLWLAVGIPFVFIYFVARQYVISHQRPIPQVVAAALGLGANIIANHMLINGIGPFPAMGLNGIALSTSVIYLLMGGGLLIYIGLSAPYRASAPFHRIWVMDWQITWRMLKIGTPIGLTIVAETGMFIAVALMIGLFGTAPLAASAIANQIAAVAFMIPLALGQASSVRVGHFAGANDRNNIGRAAWAAMIAALAVTCVTALFIALFPVPLIKLFLGAADLLTKDVISLAIPLVMITALFQTVDGAQVIGISVLRGLNDTKWPALLSVGSFWGIGVISGAIFAFYYDGGPVGLWLGLLIGLTAAALSLGWRMHRSIQRINSGGSILMG